MISNFCKSHSEVVWNVIQMWFPQNFLSLDAPVACIEFQYLIRVIQFLPACHDRSMENRDVHQPPLLLSLSETTEDFCYLTWQCECWDSKMMGLVVFDVYPSLRQQIQICWWCVDTNPICSLTKNSADTRCQIWYEKRTGFECCVNIA